jgi:hypothetical protein
MEPVSHSVSQLYQNVVNRDLFFLSYLKLCHSMRTI